MYLTNNKKKKKLPDQKCVLSRWCDGISSFYHWHTFEWASRNIHFRPSGHFRLLSWNRNLLTHLQNYFRLFHRMCDCLFWSGYSRAVPTRTEKIKLTSFTNSKMRLVHMNESRWPNFGWILTKKYLHWRILTLEHDQRISGWGVRIAVDSACVSNVWKILAGVLSSPLSQMSLEPWGCL